MLSKSEKSKIDYEHKLTVRRIIIDKAFLGAIFALLAFFAGLAIEKYKSDQITQRFLLDKKLEAVKLIGKKYNNMMVSFYNLSDPQKEILIPSKEYDLEVDDFNTALGEQDCILSDYFIEQSKFHYWIYSGLNYLKNADGNFVQDKNKFVEYREFVSEYLLPNFTKMQKNELGNRDTIQHSTFELEKMSYKKVNSTGANKYAERQLNAWKLWKNSNKPQ